MSEVTDLKDGSDDWNYYIITPQLVWALARDPHDLALWTVIKMIAGEEGECYLSTPDLAAAAMMSVGKVQDCRQYLLEMGLIQGEVRKDPGYPQLVWHLSIPHLWLRNNAWRKNHDSLKARIAFKRAQREELKRRRKLSRGERGPTPGERGPTSGERGPTPGERGPAPGEGGPTLHETKNNHKDKPQEKPFSPAGAAENPPDVLDHLFECTQRDPQPSWTVPPEAGGADAFADGPLTAFCDLVGTRPDLLSKSERRNWPKKLREIAGAHGIDAAEMQVCIKALPISDWAWRVPGFTSPYAGGFDDVVGALIRRRLAGSSVLTENDGHHRRNNRRGAHRPGGCREGTWTNDELNQSGAEALATCPLYAQYGCADFDEYNALSQAERDLRQPHRSRYVADWAKNQTGEVAEAIRAVGGVHYGHDEFLSLTNHAETPTHQR